MKFAVAPMLDWTDKHCRYFHRLLSKHAWLYTEMITTKAILFGDKKKLLDYNDCARKTILQLGGSDVKEMRECAKVAIDFGYQAVNINVGCPSNRVQSGRFGACLMKTPEVVADCVAEIKNQGIKVGVKHRIGVDEMQGYDEFVNFIKVVKGAGCTDFIVHARKAWLKGLSPKENRTKPPLNYAFVHQVKIDFPILNIVINGGIKTIQDCQDHLQKVDGVMLGREAYHNPYILTNVDNIIYNANTNIKNRSEILEMYIMYMQIQMKQGTLMHHMSKHILGLYHAQPYAKKFRQLLSGKSITMQSLTDYTKHYGIT